MDRYTKILERLETKIDDQNEHLTSIDVTLGIQSVQLRDHIRRTNLLEAQLKPIQKHIDMTKGAYKLIGILTAIGALYELFTRLI